MKELELETIGVALTAAELSGMAIYDNGVILVSDGGEDTTVFRAEERKNHRFALVDWMRLPDYEGFAAYKKSFANAKQLKKKHRRFDLEGIATCGDLIYFANERVREVFTAPASRPKKLTRLDLPIATQPDIFEGGANAGLEGIAVDCKKQHLFVAKERDPRRLYKFDLKTNKLIKAE